jgi:hypothetical protein
MPQLHAGVLYGVPVIMGGQILLAIAEQIPAQGRWCGFAAGLLGAVGVMLMVFGARLVQPGWGLSALFGSGGFLELTGDHLRESGPALAWIAWMAGVLLLTVAWLVAARAIWRLVRQG